MEYTVITRGELYDKHPGIAGVYVPAGGRSARSIFINKNNPKYADVFDEAHADSLYYERPIADERRSKAMDAVANSGGTVRLYCIGGTIAPNKAHDYGKYYVRSSEDEWGWNLTKDPPVAVSDRQDRKDRRPPPAEQPRLRQRRRVS